jgi:hypothetical protein
LMAALPANLTCPPPNGLIHKNIIILIGIKVIIILSINLIKNTLIIVLFYDSVNKNR